MALDGANLFSFSHEKCEKLKRFAPIRNWFPKTVFDSHSNIGISMFWILCINKNSYKNKMIVYRAVDTKCDNVNWKVFTCKNQVYAAYICFQNLKFALSSLTPSIIGSLMSMSWRCKSFIGVCACCYNRSLILVLCFAISFRGFIPSFFPWFVNMRLQSSCLLVTTFSLHHCILDCHPVLSLTAFASYWLLS